MQNAKIIFYSLDSREFRAVVRLSPKLFSELPTAQVTSGPGVGNLERPSLNS